MTLMENSFLRKKQITEKIAKRIMYTIIPTISFLAIIVGIFMLVTKLEQPTRIIPSAAMITISFITFLLIRKKRYILGVNVFLSFGFILLAFAMYFNGGVKAPLYISSMILILISSWLNTIRVTIIVTSLLVLMSGFFVYLESQSSIVVIKEVPSFLYWIFITAYQIMLLSVTLTPSIMLRKALEKNEEFNEEIAIKEQRLRSLISSIPGASYRSKVLGAVKLEFISDEIKNITGYDKSYFLDPNTPSHSIIHEEDKSLYLKKLKEKINQKKPFIHEYRLIHLNKSIVWVLERSHGIFDEEGELLYIDGVVIDITEQYSLKKQLNESQKMEAVGQLASGIAHDFNNILAGIQGAAELLSNNGLTEEERKKYVKLIMNSVEKSSNLTSKLLVFGSKRTVNQNIFNIKDTIINSIEILKRSIDKKIEIVTDFNFKYKFILGDESQLENIFLNLGINASHSMKTGGILKFSIKNIKIDEEASKLSTFNIKAGVFVEIKVEDNGSGISPEHIDKIFDPFFTTKEQGKGTGLGLSSVYGAIKEHKGIIKVDSQLNKGTSFTICLPVSDAVAKVNEHSKVDKKVLGNGSKILLVDDDETILFITKKILKKLNYQVFTAKNGLEAVEIFKENNKEIDLVLMDMIMPKMNGYEAVKIMKTINKDSKIIISSGFSKDKDIEGVNDMGVNDFIEKPYNINKLSNLINKVLKT